MGRQGPCNHCGTKSTPLWRSGPFEKPILCNACGSRYRSRGTLANYTPKAYVRALAPLQSNNNRNFRDYKVQTAKKPTNWQIRKVHSEESIEDKVAVSPYYSCPSGFQDGTSNGSSSGSASSVSGSHIQLESMDWNAAGPVKSSLLDFHIPTKKRSRTVRHSLSPFELLRRDLINVYQQDSSFHSASLEEVLLYESGDPTYSSEIVYGSYLLKSQSASSKEEESAASSPVVENKIACMNKSQMGSSCNEVSSTQAGLSLESMVNSVVSDRDAYDKHSPRISNNVELSHKEVFEPGKEISSLSAKRPLDPPYPPQALGSNYGTGKDFKRPKEGTFLPMPSSALKP